MILKVCITFWSLSKQGQDTILWSIQNQNMDVDYNNADDDDDGEDSSTSTGSEEDDERASGSINSWFIQGWSMEKCYYEIYMSMENLLLFNKIHNKVYNVYSGPN